MTSFRFLISSKIFIISLCEDSIFIGLKLLLLNRSSITCMYDLLEPLNGYSSSINLPLRYNSFFILFKLSLDKFGSIKKG